MQRDLKCSVIEELTTIKNTQSVLEKKHRRTKLEIDISGLASGIHTGSSGYKNNTTKASNSRKIKDLNSATKGFGGNYEFEL